MYEIIVKHDGLEKYKYLRGTGENGVKARAEELKNLWNTQYYNLLAYKSGEEQAKTLTEEAHNLLSMLENYLEKSLDIDYPIGVETAKKIYEHNEPELDLITYPEEPDKKNKKYYKNPINEDKLHAVGGFLATVSSILFFIIYGSIEGYVSSFFATILYFFSGAILFAIIDGLNKPRLVYNLYLKDKQQWENNCKAIDLQNSEIKKKHKQDLKLWQKTKDERCKEIDYVFEAYDKGQKEGIEYMAGLWLSRIPPIEQNSENNAVDYNQQTKMLVVNYFLPDFERIKKLPKEIKYIKSSFENKIVYHSESFIKKLYDSLIYQVIFAIANAIYSGDIKKHISSIVINGYVNTLDKSLGKEAVICIASLLISRDTYNELNLKLIDAKECFKRLKGISATQLQNKIPVKPIMILNKEDERFIEAYNVVNNIDGQTNLASMDWQDFENLIRELFEKKFSHHGGECKVTQASRDGGVDAVAFDPDPILGGKIIIQAKRYTNVVGVSAVRDLYGTLINEGASKGILITTSDYGIDAHKFAEGKPIVLINGNNLLQLLEDELQTKAYINIPEAKKILKESEK